MRAIERVIGITIGTMLLAAGPALAVPASGSSTIGWMTADSLAVQRVPGNILSTTLETNAGRPVYTVDIRTAGGRLRAVQVDAHSAAVLGVHPVSDPLVGEVEAP
jgi:hypothetical protein